jgi:hypothetical protein
VLLQAAGSQVIVEGLVATNGMEAMPFQVTFQPLMSKVPFPLSVTGDLVWCMPVLPKNSHGLSMFGDSVPSIEPLWLPLAACAVPMTTPLKEPMGVFSEGSTPLPLVSMENQEPTMSVVA